LDFINFQDINPDIKIWVVTDGSNPITAYHLKIGEITIQIPYVKDVLDSGGAGDAFMAMILRQLFEYIINNKNLIDLNENQFRKFLDNCVENARKACLFIGSRTYLYDYLENRNNFRSLNDFFLNHGYNGNLIKKSINLIENYGKRIQEINDSMNNKEEDYKIKLNKGVSQFESNLLNIPKIIPYAIENSSYSLEVNEIGPTLILVGSGASLSAAKAIEQLFYPPNNTFSVYSFTPYQYILKIKENYPVIIISYSGTNPDVKSSFKKALENNSKKIFLISSNKDSYLSQQVQKYINGKLIFLNTFRNEKGFVGVYSMLAFICILAKILLGKDWKSEYTEFLSEKNLQILIKNYMKNIQGMIRKNLENHKLKYHIIALGTNWAEPVLSDLESKIVESNLGTIEISELKNYTHGRYINLYKNTKNRLVILFKTPETKDLVDYLNEKLSNIAPIIVLETKSINFLGMIDLFIQMLAFVNELGKYYHIDPSKPGFPEEAKGLYNWNGLL